MRNALCRALVYLTVTLTACSLPGSHETPDLGDGQGGGVDAPGAGTGGGGGSGDPGATTTPVDPNAPGPKNYDLPGKIVPLVAASRLDWSFDDSKPEFQTTVTGLAAQCTSRRTTFLATKKVVSVIDIEGRAETDPVRVQMAPVVDALYQAPNLAFCAYFADTPIRRDEAARAVIDYIGEWSGAYVGDGNPINEAPFVQLMLAADLVLPKMTAAEIAKLKSLLEKIDAKEVAFRGALTATDGRLTSWRLHYLGIRAFANILLEDATRLSAVQNALSATIVSRYTTPSGFVLSTCANLKAVGVYGSWDLQERDSFTAHAQALLQVAPLLRLKPDLVSPAATTKIEEALALMKPYVLGQKSHPEYVCSSAQYDKTRVAADPTLAGPWDPQQQRTLFRYARLAFPSIHAWTTSFLSPEYAPWQKVYVVGKGDVVK